MTKMPQEPTLDATARLLRDPYRYIATRCRRFGSDAFQTRLLLRPTICMSGSDAAELFYDEARFARQGAMPEPVRATLLGKGGVQGLDDEEHRHRKALFVSLMTQDRVAALGARFGEELAVAATRWRSRSEIVLYDALHEPLARAVCAWAGVPLAETEVRRRTRQLVAMFDAAASIGPRHLRSRLARHRAERWLSRVIRDVRVGRIETPPGSALGAIAAHRDLGGQPLPLRIAAVELLNVLRPTVAVAVFITFAAHALHLHPEWRARFRTGDDSGLDAFVQEVRRFYPFFPAVAARVRTGFTWRGMHFPKGRRVMLDLFGTNRDARTWSEPDEFRPQRFREEDGGAFGFIPQGGGDARIHHRCPGEPVTVELMKVAVRFLSAEITYDVPAQCLDIAWSRLPALPHRRMVVRDVRPAIIGSMLAV